MITPTLTEEIKLWESGFSYIVGIDEVGRGCFAGPVVVGAVIFPKNFEFIEGIADSKLLKPRHREKLSKEIKKNALAWSIAEISVSHINKVGIGKATQMGFRKAIKLLTKSPDFVLIDAFYISHYKRKRQKPIIKGDQSCFSIAAASIIAKVYRDKLMKDLSNKYPKYGFAKHKGYGTKLHQEAIKKYGLTRLHRKSFNLDKFLNA
jgi:ribonuclease HII